MATGPNGAHDRSGIFISYRRGPDTGWVGRLFDRLQGVFGPDHVFMDADGIKPGEPFPDALERGLERSDVVLVFIGPEWTAEIERRRAKDERDWVAYEVEKALKQPGHVIPVLLDGTPMPDRSQLTDEIGGLAECNAFPMRSGSEWSSGVDRLIQEINDARTRTRSAEVADERERSAVLDPDAWSDLKLQMDFGTVVPVLGPGALSSARAEIDTLAGTAEDRVIPTELLGTPDLALLAQAISVKLGPMFPHKILTKTHGRGRPAAVDGAGSSVADAVARLPLKVFVTTGFDDELEQALTGAGKNPTGVEPPKQNLIDAGKGTGADIEQVDFDEDDPVVLHLFGSYANPKELVLNEDDFFDLFVEMRDQGFFGPHLREHLAESQLLFIGFSLNDWRFRLLLRGIATQLNDNPEQSIAVVQLDPAELREGHDRESGESFIGKYFQAKNRDIDLRAFVGSAQEFAEALLAELGSEPQPVS